MRVTNVGERDGDEVVQLYLTDEIAQVTRPVRQLIGYQRVRLPAGGSTDITFTVDAERTAFTGGSLSRIVEPGWITLSVGRSSEHLTQKIRVELTGPIRTVSRPVLLTPVRVSEV